jgi:hypothetical protein
MPIDPAFVLDCPYGPGGLLVDHIVEIDPSNDRFVGRMPTFDDCRSRASSARIPLRHPCHVSGGLMVHVTGMIAFVHAHYVLGPIPREGRYQSYWTST